jgi:hypothetical protein
MITKEKSPMRVLFFRDHEIRGLRPAVAPLPAVRPGGSGKDLSTSNLLSGCDLAHRHRLWAAGVIGVQPLRAFMLARPSLATFVTSAGFVDVVTTSQVE